MSIYYVTPGQVLGRDGGSFQECEMDLTGDKATIKKKHGRYCTIRDEEKVPPTSTTGRYWVQIFRTPDNTE